LVPIMMVWTFPRGLTSSLSDWLVAVATAAQLPSMLSMADSQELLQEKKAVLFVRRVSSWSSYIP